MVATTVSPTRDLNTDHDDDPTQPFSSPGRPFATQQFDDKNELNNDDGKQSDDGEESTGPVFGDQNGETSQVDMTYRSDMITWQNAEGQTQCVEGLYLDLYMDIPTNTAIFKLYGYVLLKGNKAKSSKQAVYLFIHPESIRTITLQTRHAPPSSMPSNFGSSHHSLCFSMTTQPHLVAPKNLVLESRPKSRALLDSIQALATVMTFTVQLGNGDMATSAVKELELIASIFSLSHHENRPSTNNRRANLTTLYAGRGGEIVNATNDVANTETCLPPYTEPAPSRSHITNKRKRSNSDIDANRSSTTNDQILLILKNICTRLDGIENRMGRLENKVSEALDGRRSPCRYGEEERLEMLEEVDNRIDDCITDLKIESQDIIQDLKDEVDETLRRLDNETNERIGRLESDVEENTTNLVEKCLRKKLLNASLRIDGSVFLDT